MADTATTQDPELQDANLGQAGDNQQPDSNEVKIREPFEIGGALHIIYDIEVDKKGKRTSNWRIKEGSQVKISGSGLEIYDQINLHIAGGVYFQKNIDRQAGGRALSFTVSNEIKDLFAEGATIELEFVSNANPANNRYLKEKFYYKGESAEEKAEAKKKLAEEQELKQAKAGQGGPGVVSEIINETIGGPAKAFGQGLMGKPNTPTGAKQGSSVGTKTITQGGTAGTSTNDDMDDDQDFVAEEEQQVTAGLASTVSQSTVGTEVIGEGSTVQGSTAGTKTISPGGTVKISAEVSAGGTTTAQQQVQTDRTVTGRESASVSGTAGGDVSAKISQKVSGTVSGGSAGTGAVSQTVSGTVGGGAANLSQNVSVDATGSATRKTPAEVAPSESNTVGNASGQVKDKSKISSTGQAQNKTDDQAPTGGTETQEKVLAGENIEAKSKTPATPNQAGENSGTEKKSTEVEQKITGQKKVEESKSSQKPTEQAPASEKSNVGQPEKKSPNQTSEKSPAQKKPAPTSTAGLGGGFNTSGGTLPSQLGGISSTLNRFRAAEAALGSRLESTGGKQPSTAQKQSGPDQNILSNAPQRAPGETGDAEKENTDGKIAEEKEETPLASPMGSPLPQEGTGTDDSQESPGEQGGVTPPGKEKSGQEENPQQESSGNEEQEESETGGGEIGVPKTKALIKAEEEKVLKEAVDLVNPYINGFLIEASIWIWAVAIPSIGLSVLLGAIAGDFLWAFKKFLIKRAISTTLIAKVIVGKKFDADEIAKQVRFSTAVKANILAMNAVLFSLIFICFLSIGAFLYIGCSLPSADVSNVSDYKLSVLGLAGYSNVCKSFMEFTQGLNGGLKGEVSGSPSGSTGSPASGTCSPLTSGIASVANLSTTCFGSNAPTASIIAAHESGGNPAIASGVDICRDQNGNKVKVNGKDASVSWGLFQINLTAHAIGSLNCPKAFDKMYTAQNHQCQVLDVSLYSQCVAAATTASINIQTSCAMSKNGTSWGPWLADIRACNLTSN